MHSNKISQMAMVLMASSGVLAHMEMVKPFPLRSQFDPQNAGQTIDYGQSRPLANEFEGGAPDFPCFGHHLTPAHSVETYAAGQTYSIQLDGVAPHNGGSCQLSLSYDDGASFKVIKSIIGNCPLQKEYSFTIPSTAPSGENILFAWTWFNYNGNREMYMNCARVDITGTSTAPFTGPEIFKGNILNDSCFVPENLDIIFPNPGPDVSYNKPGVEGKPPTVLEGCQSVSAARDLPKEVLEKPVKEEVVEEETVDEEVVDDEEVAAPAPSPKNVISKAPSVAPESSSAYASDVPTVDSAPSVPAQSSIVTSKIAAPAKTLTPAAPAAPPAAPPAAAPAAPVAAPPAAAPAGPSTTGSCTDGDILCAADGISWSVCNHGAYTPMGTVAPGTTCRGENFGYAETKPLGTCEDLAEGATKCTNGGQGWAVCTTGTWVDMGAVPAGQTCSDGKITKRSVRSYRHRRAHGAHV